jgi:hypothetical protein
LESLSSPDLVFHFLRTFRANRAVREPGESPAVYTTNILNSIPDLGDFFVGVIARLATENFVLYGVQQEFGYADLVTMLGKDRTTTLSLLTYLGF